MFADKARGAAAFIVDQAAPPVVADVQNHVQLFSLSLSSEQDLFNVIVDVQSLRVTGPGDLWVAYIPQLDGGENFLLCDSNGDAVDQTGLNNANMNMTSWTNVNGVFYLGGQNAASSQALVVKVDDTLIEAGLLDKQSYDDATGVSFVSSITDDGQFIYVGLLASLGGTQNVCVMKLNPGTLDPVWQIAGDTLETTKVMHTVCSASHFWAVVNVVATDEWYIYKFDFSGNFIERRSLQNTVGVGVVEDVHGIDLATDGDIVICITPDFETP